MARSHHRKKHKAHLRQYRNTNEELDVISRKTSVTGTITVIGGIVGAAVGYFTTDGVMTWIIAGGIAGLAAGFFIGRYIDRDPG